MATISGQWGPANISTLATFDSYTIEEVGEYTITHTATSSGNPIAFGSAIRTPHSTATSPNQNPATTTLTEQLQPGDLIEFRASSINASIGTGTWSITSDAFADPLPPNAVSPDQIGGVYVGDELAQALYHGSVLLWSRIVAVTPSPPTFHDGEPWITLPTVEGVTYSISGTPGYDASVTVTATAQAGYELVGTASWSHTFGPPPRYVASNSGGQVNPSRNTWTTVATHTVNGGGHASGTFTVNWNYVNSLAAYGVRALRNGTQFAIDGPREGAPDPQAVTIPETVLAHGDILTFEAYAGTGTPINRRINSWSWSLS